MSYDFTKVQADGLPSFEALHSYWRKQSKVFAWKYGTPLVSIPLRDYADGKGLTVQAKEYDRACRLIVGLAVMLRR